MEKAGLLSEQDIQLEINNKQIVIYPFDKKNVAGIGYDVTFSSFIYSTRDKILYDIKYNSETSQYYIEVKPSDTILVLTNEAIWLSKEFAATLHSKVEIVSKGFSNISTKVDPNWEGPLLVPLTNMSSKKVKLIIGKENGLDIEYQPISTILIHMLRSESNYINSKPPCRLDILVKIEKELKSNKKDIELIKIIEEIRLIERIHIDMQKCGKKEKDKKITQFKNKYKKYKIQLDKYIEEVSRVSMRKRRRNYCCYCLAIILMVAPVIALVIWAVNSYNNNDSSGLALIAIIASIYIAIGIPIESTIRNKLL